MDRESITKLRWLRAHLEASTDAEVIRRALKAYEIIEPADEDHEGPHLDDPRHHQIEGPHLCTAGDVEHLYIRIPARMKARLDIEYGNSGRTYGEQVRQALRVLMQLARHVDAMKHRIVEKGDGEKSSSPLTPMPSCDTNDTNVATLALVS